MKKVIIFGLGEMGKKIVEECLEYDAGAKIIAIADNETDAVQYIGIPVISPSEIERFPYDEIWICTVYFKEIMQQLSADYGVEREKMRFTEPVLPVLEQRIREKYGAQPDNKEAVFGELAEVVHYLKNKPLHMYCYPFYDEYLGRNPEITYDSNAGLYFGIYEGHKMYLARSLNTEQKARAYFNFVLMEQDARCPHCYWNHNKIRQQSGAAVDVGAAEGIYGLKIIEQIEHLYMVEAEDEWIEALRYTYGPYRNKVTIIKQFVGNADTDNTAKIDSVFKDTRVSSIKMDIEGMETEALKGAENVIKEQKPVLVICVYHHQNDNEKIGNWLRQRNYHTANSDGLVVCHGEWELKADETGFRKALLFAEPSEGR